MLLRPIRQPLVALIERVTADQRAEIDELRSQAAAIHAEVGALRAEEASLRAGIAELASQNGAARSQIDGLASQSAMARAELEELRAQGGATRGSSDSLRAEVGHVRDQLFALERVVTGAKPPGAAVAAAALGDPAVAVIIPTMNRPKYIGEAIASVQRQSFQKWELVIVGDGAGDDTAAAVAPFLKDPRIRLIRQEHLGTTHARNRGLAETTAPLVAYLDDDNLWYPEFLERAVDCMATRPDVDVLYGALVTHTHGLDRSCILFRPFSREKLEADNFIDTNVIVHRRSLVQRFGPWDPSVARLCDWDLMLRYTKEKPAYALDVLAANYRICDDQRISARVSDDLARKEIRRRTAAS
jgi:hypothetical protein